jgi:tetratricopeptide (TPR) repeat protein
MRGLLIIIVSTMLFSCSDNNVKSKELTDKSAESLIKGNYELALKQADSAIEYDKENYAAYNNRGVAKRLLKYQFKDTEADLLKSLEIESDSYVTMSSLMTLYYYNDKFDKVVKYAEAYQKLHEPDSSKLCDLIGESYRVTKEFDKSAFFLKKALELDSTLWSANLNLGELFMDMKDYKLALTYLEKAKRLNPNYSGIYNELGVSYYSLGNFDSALSFVNTALSMEKDTVYMVNKGLYLIKMDSISSGCALFKKIENMGRTIEEIYGLDSEPYRLKLKYCK